MPITNTKEIIEFLYSRQEWIIITECGPSNYRGEARCMLSNGQSMMWPNPVEGQKAGVLIYRPTIVPLEGRDGWLVTPWKEEPIEVLSKDIALKELEK